MLRCVKIKILVQSFKGAQNRADARSCELDKKILVV